MRNRHAILVALLGWVLCNGPVSAEEKDARLQEAAELMKQAEQAYQEGKYAQGVPLAERALKLREEVLGSSHRDVASSLNNLGILYRKMGDYERARPLLERALKLQEQVLGPRHPDMTDHLGSLANLYEAMGDHERAGPLY